MRSTVGRSVTKELKGVLRSVSFPHTIRWYKIRPSCEFTLMMVCFNVFHMCPKFSDIRHARAVGNYDFRRKDPIYNRSLLAQRKNVSASTAESPSFLPLSCGAESQKTVSG